MAGRGHPDILLVRPGVRLSDRARLLQPRAQQLPARHAHRHRLRLLHVHLHGHGRLLGARYSTRTNEGNVLFNDALNTFYLRLYGVRHNMLKGHSDSERGNPLSPHGLLFYMHHLRERIIHTTAFVTPVVEHWLEREIAQWVHPMRDRSDVKHTRHLINSKPPIIGGARRSSVVRAFAHGAMCRRIDPSWGGPIESFTICLTPYNRK